MIKIEYNSKKKEWITIKNRDSKRYKKYTYENGVVEKKTVADKWDELKSKNLGEYLPTCSSPRLSTYRKYTS